MGESAVNNQNLLLHGQGEMHENELHFSQLVGATSDIIYKMSADWRQMILLDGKDYLKSTASLNEDWLQAYIPKNEHERVLLIIQRATDQQWPFECEHQVYRRDGSIGWVSSRAVPILDENGSVGHWLGAASDITERKRTEADLRQAERRLRFALEAANMATWEWDLLANKVYWNEQHFLIFGLEPHSMPVDPELFFKHVDPADRERVGQQLRQALSGDEVFDTEFCAFLEDGSSRWMSGYGRVTLKVDGRPAVMNGVMYDIDARHPSG